MKEQLLSELKELTENVSDTYDDFVYGINCTMKKQDEEDIQSVIDFIKENPERTSSDIIEYLEYKIRALLSVRLFSFAL